MFGIEWLRNGAVVDRETSLLQTVEEVRETVGLRAVSLSIRLRGREPDSFRLKDASGNVIGVYSIDGRSDVRRTNIHNSTIVNSSLVLDAFNRVKTVAGDETANVLLEVAEAVSNSGNKEAGEILDQFNEELVKPQPRKSLLERSWENLVQVLPTVSAIAGATEAIAKLNLY